MGTEETGADIVADLDAAIDDTEDSPTSETGEQETAGSPESKGKTIPYSRFKEVIDTKNTLQQELDALQDRYDEQSGSLGKLTQMLEEAKHNTDLIREIQSYQSDPKMLPHLEAIDKRLRGIADEIEETGEVDDEKLNQASKLVRKQQETLDQKFADQQSDLLTQRADMIADKWLEALPEEYSEEDRKIISKLWAGEVNWYDIEANPDSLQGVLKESFQTVIDEYGTPRGQLVNPEDPDSYEIEIEEPEVKSPEEELMEAIGRKNYSSVKSTEGKGGLFTPEISDDEFADDMAKVLRNSRK